MDITFLKHISLTTIVAATIIIPVANAHGSGYVMDSSGKPISTGSGSCLRSASGNLFNDCSDEITLPEPLSPSPVKTIEAVNPPEPPEPLVVKVIPPPKPEPTHVQVLNLNESGGSNFASGSASISRRGLSTLGSFANKILKSKAQPASIKIVGHTDNVGSIADNKKLSMQRAEAVAKFLEVKGLDRNVMHVSGEGESHPVANNKTKSGRAQNRRVAITVKG